MSVHPNVSHQDLFNLSKLAKQQKNQRAIKIRIETFKQTHDIKLAENFSLITKKKEGLNESTKKLSDVIKDSISGNDNN